MDRPKVRGDCLDGPRPCPWVSCRHHLLLEVTEAGSIHLPTETLNGVGDPDAFSDRAVELLDQMSETCALDVADQGGMTLVEVGKLFQISRERVRQIEVAALEVLKPKVPQPEEDQ